MQGNPSYFQLKFRTVSVMATEDQLEVTGQASVSDLADEDILINYCLQNKIAKPAIGKL